jgi:mRNA interferase MazF
LADADRDDWVLCQITSKPYGDSRAVTLLDASFSEGRLPLVSYARPAKLFTANRALISRQVALLKPEALDQIVDAIVGLLRNVI